MPKKYSDKEFRSLVLAKVKWISSLPGTYDSKQEFVDVVCTQGHKSSVRTKMLLRSEEWMKNCPVCSKPESREEYELNPKKCEFCGKNIEFYTNSYQTRIKKFCSHECSAAFNNPLRKTKAYCLNCGDELNYHANKYCSRECSHEHKHKKNIELWKSGDLSFSGESTSPIIKRYLMDKHGNKCQICGWSSLNEFTEKIPLQVHHIDGNHKNNDESNLQLLCPNCHSLTPTFGSRNKGKGRKLRNKYR
jgi:hypothetical protein